MIKPPSVQKTYDAFYKGDPAVISIDPVIAAMPPEAEKRIEAEQKLDARITRARETGQWEDALLPGERPTIFTFKQLPSAISGELYSMLKDARSHRDQYTVYRLAFLLAIIEVKNLPDAGEINFVTHSQFGRMATPEFLDRAQCSGQLGAAIMVDLGSYVIYRAGAASPL